MIKANMFLVFTAETKQPILGIDIKLRTDMAWMRIAIQISTSLKLDCIISQLVYNSEFLQKNVINCVYLKLKVKVVLFGSIL